ncbi:MAG: hypothetical protein Q4B48_06730 [Syntrophomonadaceae bacterium]|nr:hypothetical protein [Syntrophomonadaceae bacterium]
MSSDDMQKQFDLLDTLAQKCDCAYLSNLHQRACASKLLQALLDIEVDQFPASEWNKALVYIAGDQPANVSAEAARELLLESVRKSAASK